MKLGCLFYRRFSLCLPDEPSNMIKPAVLRSQSDPPQILVRCASEPSIMIQIQSEDSGSEGKAISQKKMPIVVSGDNVIVLLFDQDFEFIDTRS